MLESERERRILLYQSYVDKEKPIKYFPREKFVRNYQRIFYKLLINEKYSK